jgi:HAD superfamily phosphatase
MTRDAIVFDCDGVLVEVTESYREAIQQTVAAFTGERPSRELIQEFKNRGGWNNDWKLSHQLIIDAGVEAPYAEVVAKFDRLFMGEDGDGLIVRERWIAKPGLIERLEKRYQLAILTGRERYELDATLGRLGMAGRFDPLITHDMECRPKPAPDGLLLIAAQLPGAKLWYVGDTVDDACCARAAGVPFIGIAAPENPRYGELVRALQREGAVGVLGDINQLEDVLPV